MNDAMLAGLLQSSCGGTKAFKARQKRGLMRSIKQELKQRSAIVRIVGSLKTCRPKGYVTKLVGPVSGPTLEVKGLISWQ